MKMPSTAELLGDPAVPTEEAEQPAQDRFRAPEPSLPRQTKTLNQKKAADLQGNRSRYHG